MNKPLVGIIMGSDSDLSVMCEAAKILDEFSISYELTIVSAHRTPKKMVDYASSAVDRGLKVIIAGAGGSAHLPGMVAAMTPLPVIGVPVQTKTLNGLDSLYSIVQMPPGIPVATMAINGAKNAGLTAIKIIGTGDDGVMRNMKAYMQQLQDDVTLKAKKLEEVGFEKYMEEKK